jgi:hypothetical protein
MLFSRLKKWIEINAGHNTRSPGNAPSFARFHLCNGALCQWFVAMVGRMKVNAIGVDLRHPAISPSAFVTTVFE